jgi:hypothetical protein
LVIQPVVGGAVSCAAVNFGGEFAGARCAVAPAAQTAATSAASTIRFMMVPLALSQL